MQALIKDRACGCIAHTTVVLWILPLNSQVQIIQVDARVPEFRCHTVRTINKTPKLVLQSDVVPTPGFGNVEKLRRPKVLMGTEKQWECAPALSVSI